MSAPVRAAGDPAPQPVQPWRAALLMSAATLCFTSLDSILKWLVATHGLGMLVTVRNLVQVLLLAALAPWLGRAVYGTRQLPLHLARGACIVATTVLVTLALSRLPMAQTYAITFSAPFMAALLAAALLRERPRAGQWALIVVGFAGVVIAIGPGTPSFGWPILLPLGMAGANAIFFVLTRRAGQFEGAMTLAFWGGGAALLWCLLGLPFLFEPLPAAALWWLALAGAFGALAHLCAAAAFRRAPTATVAPIVYTQIIWAGLIGYLVFGETPQLSTWAGGLVVAASGIALVRAANRP